VTAWADDPRTDDDLLAAYCVPAPDGGEDWWAFRATPVSPRGVPRPAADQAEFIRACLLLGTCPSDVVTSQVITRIVMKLRDLDQRP
jgi:hypothetical protein